MSKGGEIVERSIFSFVSKKHLTIGREVRRYGNPLSQQMERLIPGLTSTCDHVTNVTIKTMFDPSPAELLRDLRESKPDAIITPYSSTNSWIKEWAPDQYHDLVHNTHGFQGQEVKRALVILRPVGGQWGLNGDKQYLISACTRPSHYLEVWVIDWAQVNTIEELVTQGAQGQAQRISEDLLNLEKQIGTKELKDLTMENVW